MHIQKLSMEEKRELRSIIRNIHFRITGNFWHYDFAISAWQALRQGLHTHALELLRELESSMAYC